MPVEGDLVGISSQRLLREYKNESTIKWWRSSTQFMSVTDRWTENAITYINKSANCFINHQSFLDIFGDNQIIENLENGR